MYGKIYVRTTAKDAPKAIAAAEKKWKTWNAAYPFAYFFLDDTFNELYKTEQRTGILFNVFAIMAVFISCLGLFGLAAYTAQLRTKEIGLRKVLGASVTGITRLIAKDFMKLVLIAIVIALPLAKYIMNQWLHDFAYKANIHWTLFIAPGLIAIGIAGFTISFQAIKAAVANPIKSLRTE
jgi:putative ABC transport system permease protein